MDAEAKWTTNEGLLQSYRQILITSQSFFLAVGAILFTSQAPTWLFVIVAFVGLVLIWVVWFPVVRSRHLIVDYWKAQHEGGKDLGERCSESDYVGKRAQRAAVNAELGMETNWRPTRIRLDGLLPGIYTFLWLLLAVYKLGLCP